MGDEYDSALYDSPNTHTHIYIEIYMKIAW
jgi:hypothetical protein